MLNEARDLIVQWDHIAWYYINVRGHNSLLDFMIPFLRNPVFWAPLYLFLAIFIPAKYRRNGLFWCLAFILTFALSDQVSASLLKPYFHRLRPCHNPWLKDMVHLMVDCGGEYGFPSVHATNHFALGIFTALTLSRQVKWIWPVAILWALIISYAQIYVGVHFPLDVAFGALTGTIVGIITGKIFNRFFRLEKPPENQPLSKNTSNEVR